MEAEGMGAIQETMLNGLASHPRRIRALVEKERSRALHQQALADLPGLSFLLIP
jgi:hypothetical protein